MTAPRFASTAALHTRRQTATPVVDRATFVVFVVSSQRYAVPAESAERVLRAAPTHAGGALVVDYRGRLVPVINLRAALLALPLDCEASLQRTLVFSVQDVLIAARVDAVTEVVTIEAAEVRPVASTSPDRVPAGVRGQFALHGDIVWVLDMLRVVRTVYEGVSSPTVPGARPSRS